MPTKKTILILTYYWPPSGGAGVQRWLKLSKELSRLGHAVHVVSVRTQDAHYPHWDETLERDIEPGIAVHRTPAFNPIRVGQRLLGRHANQVASSDLKGKPSRLGELAMRLRTHLFIPDPRKGWNKSATRKALELIRSERIDTLVTTGPPHSTHLIGLAVKKRATVRWFADFRDPWTDVFYYEQLKHSPWSAARDARFERQVMEQADDLIVVHDRYREKLEAKYPHSVPGKIHYLPNGFDAEDFSQARPAERSPWFEIVYTGIMAAGYEPEVVAEAWAQGSIEQPARLTVVGTAPESVLDTFRKAGMEVQCLGMQPHEVANAWQQRADLLLCLIPAIPGAELAHVPGKIYEYLAAGKPILNIGPPSGESASIVSRCEAGMTCSRTESARIAAFLEQIAGQAFHISESGRAATQQYARSAQALRLQEWIQAPKSAH